MPTDLNSADLATRGLTADGFQRCKFRLNGLHFLVQPEFRSTFPIPNADHRAALEKHKQRAVSTNVAAHSGGDFTLKFSDFRRLTRVVAYIRRFQLKREEVPETKVISNEEFQTALIVVFRVSQTIEFEIEIERLKSKGSLKKMSKLKALDPFIDENDLLRV